MDYFSKNLPGEKYYFVRPFGLRPYFYQTAAVTISSLNTLRSSLHLFSYNSANNSINTMNFWIIYHQADLTKSSPQSWIKFSDKNIEDSTNARLHYCRRISIFDDIFGTVKIQQGQNNLQSEANNGEVLRHQKSDGRTNGRKKSPLAR